MTLEHVLTLWLFCTLAYAMKGFGGFGSALVFVPVVTTLTDPTTGLATSAIVDLFVGSFMLIRLRPNRAQWRVIMQMSAFIVVGTLLGSAFVGAMPAAVLKALIAGAVLPLGIYFLVRRSAAPPLLSGTRRWALSCGSFIGGVTGAVVGASGPPIIAVARPVMDRNNFRTCLTGVFLIEGVFKLIAYGLFGVWSDRVLTMAWWAAPAVILGLLIGFYLHHRVDERRFTMFIGVVLLFLGSRLVVELF